MQVFYSTQFVLPLPPGHRFPMGKYQMLRDRLADELPQIRLETIRGSSSPSGHLLVGYRVVR